jgi:hypothetical protein
MDEIKFEDVESMAEVNPDDCNALQKLGQCICRASSTAESDIQYPIDHLRRCSVCDPAKLFFTSKFSCLVFCNTTNKIEIGTSNRWGTTKTKPPPPIIMMVQSETLGSSHIKFITLFSAGAHRFSAIYRPPQTVQLYSVKTMFLSQTSMFLKKIHPILRAG